MFKAVLKTIALLIIAFIMLYVGMTNTHAIDFYFPIAVQKPVHAPAALIFFGVFVVGVLAGTMLHTGGGGNEKGGGKKSSSKDK